MVSITMTPVFQKTGWWYDYMTGDSIQITITNAGITLNPGEFKVYTDVNLNPKTKPTSIQSENAHSLEISVFPNPAQSKVSLVTFKSVEKPNISLFDVNGKLLNINVNSIQRANNEWVSDLDLSDISRGLYFIHVTTKEGSAVKQLIVSE
jgi:hypothetical protein